MRVRSALLVVALMVVAGCTGTTEETSTTVVTTATTQAITTTEAEATATTVVTTSTTTQPEMVITLSGPQLVYSADGLIVITGDVNREAEVTADGESLEFVFADQGSTRFEGEVSREPGEHQIEIVASDRQGNLATAVLSVVVDPDLEIEMAYIEAIGIEDGTVTADYVQWLTGPEAVDAAREDGWIAEDEDLPNDYYIRNQNTRLRTFPLSADTVIVLQACYVEGPCVTTEGVDFGTWAGLVAEPDSAAEAVGWQWYGQGALPYWLTVQDGVVVQVQEQYLP